ncbi:MAG: hypothetical protein Q7S33_04705 [Nanoarchaeota archaeon]|nr:hypothetical protein [Nanoarchaeota archaeon]
MTEKCCLCNDEISETFLDKTTGTIIKIKNKDKNEKVYVCSLCQKKFRDKLKEEVEKKTGK